MEEPSLCHIYCLNCSHEWEALFPDGFDEEQGIECPECGKMDGEI